MCETIRTKSGNDISTVREMQDYFKVDIASFSYEMYNSITLDACLCQINLKLFFENNPKFRFVYSAGDWFEIDIQNKTVRSCLDCPYADKDKFACLAPNQGTIPPYFAVGNPYNKPSDCPMNTTELIVRWD